MSTELTAKEVLLRQELRKEELISAAREIFMNSAYAAYLEIIKAESIKEED